MMLKVVDGWWILAVSSITIDEHGSGYYDIAEWNTEIDVIEDYELF